MAQTLFTASKIEIIAAAAAHQHELQHLLILTEQHVIYVFLHLEGVQIMNRLLQKGQQAIQKMLVLMACKCLSMSCTMSEGFQCVLRLRTW